jgi:putative glutamine amidotransferase
LHGVYHEEEEEDYSDAQAFIQEHHMDWVSLEPAHCPLEFTEVYQNNACRKVFSQWVRDYDGIIFNGGDDIVPQLYNAPQMLTTMVLSPRRSIFEASLAAHLLGTQRHRQVVPLLESERHSDFVVLGICMGMQILNIANGGTLYQDIPSELYGAKTVEDIENGAESHIHSNPLYRRYPTQETPIGVFHPVVFTEASAPLLSAHWQDKRIQVWSIHHQSIRDVAPDFVVTAKSKDGKVIEGIRHRHFRHVWGWQFHPERSEIWEESAIDGPLVPFQQLVQDKATEDFHVHIWKDITQKLVLSQQQRLTIAHKKEQ